MQLIGSSKDTVHLGNPGVSAVHRLTLIGGAMRVQNFALIGPFLVSDSIGGHEELADSGDNIINVRRY